LLVGERAVVVRRDAHRLMPPQLVEQRLHVSGKQSVAVGVDAIRPLLDGVVRGKHRSQGGALLKR
jgi:hypothetical protein